MIWFCFRDISCSWNRHCHQSNAMPTVTLSSCNFFFRPFYLHYFIILIFFPCCCPSFVRLFVLSLFCLVYRRNFLIYIFYSLCLVWSGSKSDKRDVVFFLCVEISIFQENKCRNPAFFDYEPFWYECEKYLHSVHMEWNSERFAKITMLKFSLCFEQKQKIEITHSIRFISLTASLNVYFRKHTSKEKTTAQNRTVFPLLHSVDSIVPIGFGFTND